MNSTVHEAVLKEGKNEPGVVLATFRAYNDFIAEFCETNSQRLIGIGVIPAYSPEAGAKGGAG